MSAARGAAVTAERVTRHLDAIGPTSAFSANRTLVAKQRCTCSAPLRVNSRSRDEQPDDRGRHERERKTLNARIELLDRISRSVGRGQRLGLFR